MSLSGFDFDNDYYENTKYFDDEGKETVLIFVEDTSDINVWSEVFPKVSNFLFEFQPTDMFDFGDGVVSTGCDRIAKLIKNGTIRLGKNVIVCMDSDYHKLMNFNRTSNKEVLTSPYVYLTVFHSIENIKHFTENLDAAFSRSLGVHPSMLELVPSDIALVLSQALYEPMAKYFYLSSLKSVHNSEYNNKYKELLKIVRFMSNASSGYLKSNTELYKSPHWVQGLVRLCDVDGFLYSLIENKASLPDCLSYKDFLRELGFRSDNAYLFFRGHDIEYFFHKILDAAHEEYLKVKVNRLENISKKNSQADETITQKTEHLKKEHRKYSFCSNYLSQDIKSIPHFSDTCQRIQQVYG